MTKEQKWLAILAFLDQLQPWQFTYTNMVLWKEKQQVLSCCVLGWLPRTFPNDFQYFEKTIKQSDPFIALYLDIPEEHVNALFYGFTKAQRKLGLPLNSICKANLDSVRSMLRIYVNKYIINQPKQAYGH